MPEDALPFDKHRQPELAKPGARKPLTREQVLVIAIRQVAGGMIRCGCGCGDPLDPVCIDEHVVPRETLPADVADNIDNRALYNKPCAKLKTVADQAVIAHWRRARGEKGQRARREKRGGSSIPGRPLVSGSAFPKGQRKIASRPFQKRTERV